MRVPFALSVTSSVRLTPAEEGPSASVSAAEPPDAAMSLTLRRSALLVPMARISVPRSIFAASAGAPSNASETNRRRLALS
ncbi:hypothetical protein [Parasphingopyxis sp.]|uniref:hypothetical protein n=1 Tax=Parasphingopyxis sp. TaxID=1920299 RepID=UPI003F9F1C06